MSPYVHQNDPDPFLSNPHGHIGHPESPLKVDVFTGEIYNKTVKTGEKLSEKTLRVLQNKLEEIGLLGLGLLAFDPLTADDTFAAIGEALDL